MFTGKAESVLLTCHHYLPVFTITHQAFYFPFTEIHTVIHIHCVKNILLGTVNNTKSSSTVAVCRLLMTQYKKKGPRLSYFSYNGDFFPLPNYISFIFLTFILLSGIHMKLGSLDKLPVVGFGIHVILSPR